MIELKFVTRAKPCKTLEYIDSLIGSIEFQFIHFCKHFF